MNKPIAVVDLDDTIADMAGLMTECLNHYTGLTLRKEDFDSFDVSGKYGISNEEFYRLLDKDGVIDELAVLPGARTALERLSHDHEVVIVTARHHFRDPLTRTLKWVKSRGLPVDRVLVSGGTSSRFKSNVVYNYVHIDGVQVFFDDGMHNVWDMYDSNMAEKIFIPSQPWNIQAKLDENIHRCRSLRDCVSCYYADYVEGR